MSTPNYMMNSGSMSARGGRSGGTFSSTGLLNQVEEISHGQ
jgi:hypothetical protein